MRQKVIHPKRLPFKHFGKFAIVAALAAMAFWGFVLWLAYKLVMFLIGAE